GWLLVAIPRMMRNSESIRTSLVAHRWVLRGAAGLVGAAIALLLVVLVSGDFYRRLDKAAMTERFGKAFERAGNVAGQLRLDWDLASWAARKERPDLINLSLYINACT